MKKKILNKLELNKKTVSNLSKIDMKNIRGATIVYACTRSCTVVYICCDTKTIPLEENKLQVKAQG